MMIQSRTSTRSLRFALTVVWGALLSTTATHAQSLELVPAGPERPAVSVEADFGWQKTARTPDRVIWQASVGALTIVYTSHPQRSGIEGMYVQTPGDCVMRLQRADLADHAISVERQVGGDHLVFTSSSGTRRVFSTRVSQGCDPSTAF